MTPSESQYFALLRSAMWDTPVTIDGSIDWNEVMRIAQHHANEALLCGVASQMTTDNRPSEAMLGKMQSVVNPARLQEFPQVLWL